MLRLKQKLGDDAENHADDQNRNRDVVLNIGGDKMAGVHGCLRGQLGGTPYLMQAVCQLFNSLILLK